MISACLIGISFLSIVLTVLLRRYYLLYNEAKSMLDQERLMHKMVFMRNNKLVTELRHQAVTDGLTGLFNHVYFKNRLQEELRLASRKGTFCSLLMIDLDKLKQINDTYGHQVGDMAIKAISHLLKTSLRSGDTAARYGGEEFAIILPATALHDAALIAERLGKQIAQAKIPQLGNITASIGIAAYPEQANDTRELIEAADQALYCAKHAGRDQVWTYAKVEQPADKLVIEMPAMVAETSSR